MENNFYSGRPLSSLDDEQIEQLLDSLSTIPELLMEAYWEVSHRRNSGWLEKLDLIESSYVRARTAELDQEVKRLKARRSEALELQGDGNPVSATIAKREQAAVFSKVLKVGLEASLEEHLKNVFKPTPAGESSTQPILQKPAPSVPPKAALSTPPANWIDTAAQVRNASISTAFQRVSQSDFSTGDWAKHSPLSILGYKVGESGLSQMRRQAFLSDFVKQAVLPTTLPKAYLAEWGEPLSITRLQRTVSHIAFQRVLRERSDPAKYHQAISDWQSDLDFLEESFQPSFTSHEWERLRRSE